MKTCFKCLDLDVNMSFGCVADKLTVLFFSPEEQGAWQNKGTFKRPFFF